jgi:GNAT superfamily N-acetyltransferase
MSNIKCVVSSISTILSSEVATSQFINLVEAQWLEVDHRRKTGSLDIDFSRYEKMEELGMHYMVFAFEGDKLIGYNSMLYSESPHTKELTALTDSMYILKEHRKSGIGSEMIKVAEVEAKRLGCKHIMVTFKNSHPHPSIVEELGFFSYETIYAKAIGD